MFEYSLFYPVADFLLSGCLFRRFFCLFLPQKRPMLLRTVRRKQASGGNTGLGLTSVIKRYMLFSLESW